MGRFDRDRGGFQSRGRSFGNRDRPMYKATCSNCGKECEVPFRPTSGKPVYCSDCFEKFGPQRSDSPRPERTDFRAPDAVNAKLEAMNVKIERILKLLEPKIAPEAAAKTKKKTSAKKR